MGLIHTNILLRNPQTGSKAINVEALVDNGALHLCIPPEIAEELNVETVEHRRVTVATGEQCDVPYVGPIQVSFEGRNCFTGALVMGTRVLLGAVPMEDMDLIADPAKRKLSVNPESPDIPSSLAVSVKVSR